MEKSLESLPLDGIIRTKEDIIEAIKKLYLLITGKNWDRENPREILGIFNKIYNGSYINFGREIFLYELYLYKENEIIYPMILDGRIKPYLNELFDVNLEENISKI